MDLAFRRELEVPCVHMIAEAGTIDVITQGKMWRDESRKSTYPHGD